MSFIDLPRIITKILSHTPTPKDMKLLTAGDKDYHVTDQDGDPPPLSSLDPVLVRLINLLAPFRTYDPPNLDRKWESIWYAPSLELDMTRKHYPRDPLFESTIFHLQLSASDTLRAKNNHTFPIRQGTTIAFKGINTPHRRYIVDWCQWVENHKAYLKVVGVDVFGERFRFDHPDFPTFILVVPICIADVPFPFSNTDCIDYSAYDTTYTEWNGKTISCRVCASPDVVAPA